MTKLKKAYRTQYHRTFTPLVDIPKEFACLLLIHVLKVEHRVYVDIPLDISTNGDRAITRYYTSTRGIIERLPRGFSLNKLGANRFGHSASKVLSDPIGHLFPKGAPAKP